MKKSIGYTCPACGAYEKNEIIEGKEFHCFQCQKAWPKIQENQMFEECPFCQCRQFYIQKDFSQLWGCFIMAVGILLVPLTYGLSLPCFALLDWFFYKRVAMMALCYRCGAEYRGFSIPENLKTFLHHIGDKYDREKKS